MRELYGRQLRQLDSEMANLGALCEKAIASATKALLDGDMTMARQVLPMSGEIEQKERDIVALCMKLLLKQQPVAGDFRTVSSALKMVTDMKRIGDHSADIAEIVTMANISQTDNMLNIHDMAVATIKMVSDSIEAFIKRDLETARAVIDYDDVVDDCFNTVKLKLIELFSKPETDGEYAIDLLMIAKYFERIGDNAVNIAQWVIFAITGERD